MIIKILEKLRYISPSLPYKYLQLTNNTIRNEERFTEFWWRMIQEGRMSLTIREAFNIYYYLTKSLPLGGSIAEVGVYKGGGAKLISEFKSDLTLHLFDTFEGMPEVNSAVDLHLKGDFSDTTLESVQRYLKSYSNIHFHKGIFPNSSKDLPKNIQFCFVHLDVDIYESTLSGLNFFYPRLKEGGVIISHDYNSISCPGVKKAYDEFFVDKNEDVFFLWDTQCMIRKR
ncbi:class I SAM-dependent methyltransferase [bacterium]|nr:class I SAM-dependent methyltransferase [bacterium]